MESLLRETPSTAALATSSAALVVDSPYPTFTALLPSPTNVTAGIDPPPPPELLCSWVGRVHDCKDAEFIKWPLISSALLHFTAFAFGIWLLWYRSGGFERTIVTNVVVQVGFKVQPRPLDSTVFLTTIAFCIRVIGIILQLLDKPLWLFILFEQLYWTTLCLIIAFYIGGFLNCLPVTEIRGYFAVFRQDPIEGGSVIPPVYLIYLSPGHRIPLLFFGAMSPLALAVGPGVAVGLLKTYGYEYAAESLETFQYCGWWVLAWTGSSIAMYFGQKLTIIIRNYIVVVEAKHGLPARPLGIRDLGSSSSARYLWIMIQITTYGALLVYLLAGSLCGLWALRRAEIRRTKNELWPHVMAVVWTCANALTFLVKLILVTFRTRYSKVAGMLDQTATGLPLGSGSVSEQQVMETKAIGPIVQPKNHTREGSSLEQALRAIGPDQIDSFRSICLKSTEILHGRDEPHNVTAGAAHP